jgi:hypothetical protein
MTVNIFKILYRGSLFPPRFTKSRRSCLWLFLRLPPPNGWPPAFVCASGAGWFLHPDLFRAMPSSATTPQWVATGICLCIGCRLVPAPGFVQGIPTPAPTKLSKITPPPKNTRRGAWAGSFPNLPTAPPEDISLSMAGEVWRRLNKYT